MLTTGGRCTVVTLGVPFHTKKGKHAYRGASFETVGVGSTSTLEWSKLGVAAMMKRPTHLTILGLLFAGSVGLIVGCAEDNNANMMKSGAAAGGGGAAPTTSPAGPTPPPMGPGGAPTEEFKKFRAEQDKKTYSGYPGVAPH